MVDLSVNDIIQIYKDTLCLYNGLPVKVKDINPDKKIRIFNIMTQKYHWVTFEFDKFSAPKCRIGYVNIMGHSLYISRKPVRRYSNGITRGNLRVSQNEGDDSPGLGYAVDLAGELTHPALIQSVFGIYPTIEEALNECVEGRDHSVAFDRQFAVNEDRAVFYKAKYVGSVDKKTNKISFDKSFAYLKNLLETHHGKNIV